MDRTFTLCWDCRKACGGCSWSNYDERRPVPGWTAVETKIRMKTDVFEPSCIVIACPEFERDGIGGGAYRPGGEKSGWKAAALRRKAK